MKSNQQNNRAPLKNQPTPPQSSQFSKLLNFNLFMGFLHALQAIAVFLLSDSSKGIVPIVTNYLKFNPQLQQLQPATEQLFNTNLAWLVILFFALSSFFHFAIATFYRPTYERNLSRGMNKARWIEYSLSASVMMLAISLLSGIYDLSSLVMIFALDAIMNLMGLAMEKQNSERLAQNKPIDWFTFWIGCLAGIIPWVVFAFYVIGARQLGGGTIPTFVYWIYVSIFIFFNSFALNMWLQYKKVGKWSDYLYGERAYIILSLVAKSLLAWQVFAGTLRP